MKRIILIFPLFALTLYVYTQSNDHNWITTHQLQVEIQDENQVGQLDVYRNQKIIQYFDYLGRPIQVNKWQSSPELDDIIQQIEYDQYGREVFKYLPYSSSQNGFFDANYSNNL